MKIVIASAMVLGLTSFGAFADEPVRLTDSQLDTVTAGARINAVVVGRPMSDGVAGNDRRRNEFPFLAPPFSEPPSAGRTGR